MFGRSNMTSQKTKNIRRWVIQGFIIIIAMLLSIRLFTMQVLDPKYKTLAKNNIVRERIINPSRGLIADREGRLLIKNEVVYDLMITMKQVADFDTFKFCKLLNITKQELILRSDKMRKTKGYSPNTPQVLLKLISDAQYNSFQEYLYQFRGITVQRRTIRSYPYNSAAHILGYIGEVTQDQLDTSTYYKPGDYIGQSGIELSYEKELRGQKGIHLSVVDVHNREIGSYLNGEYDQHAKPGKDLQLTIDIDLQQYAELLMQNKRGSVVAIEPKTGEVLALVSSPTYNPNLLTGKARGAGFKLLASDSIKPLFNRALMAKYPPGSTFKPVMALIAMNEKVISPNYYFGCNGGYKLSKRRRVKCHGHAPCYNVAHAIMNSCNTYFCQIYKLTLDQERFDNVGEGLLNWDAYLNNFGIGCDPKIDLPAASDGFVPKPDYYNNMYGKGKWIANTIISMGIGQGELGTSPLQMANATAIIAGRGIFKYPHIARPNPADLNNTYNKTHRLKIDDQYFESITNGMEKVMTQGTAKNAYTPYLEVCGKTGTAQNPHGKDHSLFVGFAPKNNPKIAISVIVENGGWGADYGAVIGSLVMDKYINDTIMGGHRRYLENKMIKTDLIYNRRSSFDYSSWDDMALISDYANSSPSVKFEISDDVQQEDYELIREELGDPIEEIPENTPDNNESQPASPPPSAPPTTPQPANDKKQGNIGGGTEF